MNISFMAFALFLSFIFFLFPFSYANNTITPGQSLLDGQTMLSPTEDFVLGFFSPGNSPSRYVGIWYNRVSVRTIVWVANRNNPVPDSSGSLTMGRNGNLLVLDGTGTSLWSTNVSVASSNATAVFLDSGNLILSIDQVPNPDSAIWQSFNYPTDTYLPGMMVGLIPRSIPHLFTSWKSENDPSVGNFSMGMDPTGMDQIVVWEGSQRRWRSGLWNGQIFTGVPNMTANYLFGFRVFPVGGRTFFTYSVHNSSEFLRFRMKWDGTEEQVLWDEGRSEWRRLWAQPTRECEIYNTCGAYGSCNRWNSQICSCIQGFEPRSSTEWRSGNWSGGCVRRKPLLCDRNITNAGEGDRDQFLELDEVKLPDFSFARPSDNRSHCADICSNNCSCKAYAYVSGISCLTWSRDFVDVQIFREGGQKLYIRLAASEFGESNSRLTLIIVLVVVFGTLLLCTTAFIYWRCRSKPKKLGTNEKSGSTVLDEIRSRECWSEFSTQHDVEGNNASELPMHSLQVIVDATNNFSTANKLGEGGFGPVYKGKMPCGLEVAVKRLSQKSFQGLEEFKNEIILIAKLQHRNLVRLVGFCVEGEEKMLLYEYLPNKSLDAFIFANQQEQLSWKQRSDIIEGIARGLLYLHRDSRLRIIHRDLKASNILLDEEMNPKISDFGMAKIFGGNQNQANTTRVVGTYGYMAPEYAMEGLFSVKSDVYSFGVLLLEIVSGKKNQYRHPEVSMNLIGYAWKLWGEERAAEFIDPSIRDSHSQSKALRCINIGLLCVQDSAMDRPIMSTVVLMLESDSPILPTPRQPTTFTMGRSPLEIEISLDSSEAITKNSMSDTMVVGR